jgi:hypothetical protein
MKMLKYVEDQEEAENEDVNRNISDIQNTKNTKTDANQKLTSEDLIVQGHTGEDVHDESDHGEVRVSRLSEEVQAEKLANNKSQPKKILEKQNNSQKKPEPKVQNKDKEKDSSRKQNSNKPSVNEKNKQISNRQVPNSGKQSKANMSHHSVHSHGESQFSMSSIHSLKPVKIKIN